MEWTLRLRGKIIIRSISSFISKDKIILDIGCGNGVITNQIQQNFDCRIVGTDIIDYRKKILNSNE